MGKSVSATLAYPLLVARFPVSCYCCCMTITQTVDIPESRRLVIDVPREIPVGRTVLAFTPAEADSDEGYCPLCAPYRDPESGRLVPNAETIAAFEEGDAMKNREQLKEDAPMSREKAERLNKEAEYSRRMWEKHFDDRGTRFGEIADYMFAPSLREKFWEMGHNYYIASSNCKINDYNNNIFFAVNVKLENNERAMLIEVRTNLTTEDVKDHIERLEKMRKYADLHDDKRTFLGAVAGAVMTDNIRDYALKQGFYVIEPSGETFNIIPPNGDPKEW